MKWKSVFQLPVLPTSCGKVFDVAAYKQRHASMLIGEALSDPRVEISSSSSRCAGADDALMHYRTGDGVEVDGVLERRDGDRLFATPIDSLWTQ